MVLPLRFPPPALLPVTAPPTGASSPLFSIQMSQKMSHLLSAFRLETFFPFPPSFLTDPIGSGPVA